MGYAPPPHNNNNNSSSSSNNNAVTLNQCSTRHSSAAAMRIQFAMHAICISEQPELADIKIDDYAR